MTTEELKIIISAQNSDFQRKLNESKTNLTSFGRQAEKTADTTLAAFDKIKSGAAALFSLRYIKSFANETKELYNTQLTAEQKLTQVMRNTMKATDDEIAATKEWASELQKVGIIGDEVTLSGLQKLATYISDPKSLQSLSVVMDDMLAQMYGFDASAESAASTASILGKALQGQTSMLARYGYSVTEAQENILKYGTEEERVATLAEIVEKKVGGMNTALAQTNAGKLKQYENTIGDIKEQFGAAFTELGVAALPIFQVIAQGLSALTPVITWIADGVERLVLWWDNLNPIAKTFLKIALVAAIAIPAVTLAIKLFTLAQAGLYAMQAILIPQTATLGAVTKAAFGWLALAAGAIAILASFGGSSDVSESTADIEDLSGVLDATDTVATDTADAVDDLSDSMDSLSKATSNLAGFDELNILDSDSGTLAGKLVSKTDLSNLNKMSDSLNEINELLKKTQNNAKKGVKVGFSQDFVEKLRAADEKVRSLFGDRWSNFWDRIGKEMYEGIEEGNWYPLLDHLEGITEQLFGPGWNSFWERVGQDMYRGIEEGDWYPLLEDLEGGVEKLFGKKWTEFWEGVGSNWQEFWEGVGGTVFDIIDGIKTKSKEAGYALYDLFNPEEDVGQGDVGLLGFLAGTNGGTKSNLQKYLNRLEWIKFAQNGGAVPNIRGYASGGMPNYGELFVANESGAEYIGKVGNRAAVANQDQMRAEMRQGVKEGVMEALAMRSDSNGDIYIIMDGDEIAYHVEKRSARLSKRTGGR